MDSMQTSLNFTRMDDPTFCELSPEAARVAADLREDNPVGSISDAVYDELEAAGILDEVAELDEASKVDWADPDAHDLALLRWYDERADPYTLLAGGIEAPETCEFLLGTHRPNWLHPGSRERRPAGPCFVSVRALTKQRAGFADPDSRSAFPPCDVRFSIDSGGFTQITQRGQYDKSPAEYVAQVRALAAQTGTLDWAAIQDWMVEDAALKRTGLTVEEHQRRTVQSYLDLTELAPEVRWLPVLQGRTVADYLAHLDMSRAAGVCLGVMTRVGVGSVCRRQGTKEIVELLRELAARGLRLHGFGVKSNGLRLAAEHLASSDSLAWSSGARYRDPGQQNSIHVAEAYRSRIDEIDGVND